MAVDLDALAQKHGGAVDYDALASKYSAEGTHQPDVFQKAVNYHSGNPFVDTPLGLIQGAAKGAAELGETIGAAARYVTGRPQVSQEEKDLDTKPSGPGQGTGKFIEQGLEYALPAGMASKALKGAGVVAKAGAQAGIGAGVSALQTQGSPTATALGGVLGAAGEVVPAAVAGVKAIAGAKAANLQNFSNSFAAVPTQKTVIGRALPTLIKDGIRPEADPLAMQGVVKDKLQALGQQYQALPADIGDRALDPASVIKDLRTQQMKHASVSKSGEIHVSDTHEADFSRLQKQIDSVQTLADQNGGQISFAQLKYLRDGANGKTNFASPDSEKQLYEGIGDAYRAAMSKVAPETTQLNRDYATYKSLESVVDHNVSYGRGITKSGLQTLIDKNTGHAAGASLGYAAGHLAGGPVGGAAGAAVGSVLFPKLAGPVRQALQNSIDNGAFKSLSPATQLIVRQAAKMGDGATVSKFLQRIPVTAVQNGQDRT